MPHWTVPVQLFRVVRYRHLCVRATLGCGRDRLGELCRRKSSCISACTACIAVLQKREAFSVWFVADAVQQAAACETHRALTTVLSTRIR